LLFIPRWGKLTVRNICETEGIHMAKEHMLFDKTEIKLVVMRGNSASLLDLKFDQINSITFRPCEESTLFGKKPSEEILIKTKKAADPFVYSKLKEKNFWEGYKDNLRKFAKENRITLVDDLAAK
jgi:hypothetical protein